MDKPLQKWLGQVVFAALLMLPTLLAALSPLQTGRATIWLLGTLAGVLSLSLMVVQVFLPTRWLNALIGGNNWRWHSILGVSVTGLAIAHV
ncbi:hypothetical protein HC931_07195 [Candidatus Gracilibacteria bacterium]|nr:hypothetical protein [Candidatus Gracilibacteria bacterium]NJM85922.1 hypothetical protein [Hydrococcus sp. RU_2_2]NJP18762.1 hypothetical protein [Hydrococcus sp. CRU_1_1]